MKRNHRRDNGKRERFIMLASSAFVLAALTMTGIYIQSRNTEPEDDGYVIDFTAMENSADEKAQEIAQNLQNEAEESAAAKAEDEDESLQAKRQDSYAEEADVPDEDLDYMPIAAGSSLVEIPGLTDQVTEEAAETLNLETASGQTKEQASVQSTGQTTLHFAEADGLLRPVEGEVLLPFSMDSSIYFSTLDQYKYNPALMLVAAEGEEVTACAAGKVLDIFEDAQIGQAVTMELGDGYELTYGQLKDITVKQGSYVKAGEVIGKVAAPTKYFSMEGANLYLKLTSGETPVNPEPLFVTIQNQ